MKSDSILGDHAAERRSYMEFTVSRSYPEFREPLRFLYGRWEGYSGLLYGGRLAPPHLVVGDTPPALAAAIRPVTGYGASTEAAFRRSLVIDPAGHYVTRPWGEGHGRFLADLMLRLTVLQKLMEEDGALAHRSGRHAGAALADEINRVGPLLGLQARVTCRRRRGREGMPLASGWPHNVRPADHYLGHVTPAALALAGVEASSAAPIPAEGSATVWHVLSDYLARGEHDALGVIFQRRIEWIARRGRFGVSRPVNFNFERGREDADGRPITSPPVFDPGWLAWQDGLAARFAQGLLDEGCLDTLPILADLLEDAGCRDQHILAHLRAPRLTHGPSCWVLAGVLDAARRGRP